MYCGMTISANPRQISGELYTNENAEVYIEYCQNGTIVREEVLPSSVQRTNETQNLFSILAHEI